MKSVVTFVLDELSGMLQVYEVSFVTKIIYVFRINQQKLCAISWDTQSVKISPFLSKCEV